MPLRDDVHAAFAECNRLRAAIDNLPTQDDFDALVDVTAKAAAAECDGLTKTARYEWNRFDGLIGIMREKIAKARAERDA